MENKSKIIIASGIVTLIILGILLNYVASEFFTFSGNFVKRVYVRGILVKAEVVSTPEKIERGLAGRKSIAIGRGMLFDMPSSTTQKFWMKGMRFPIDIIWIENGRVIGCEKNISPEDERIFTSPDDAGNILEVPSGFCEGNRIRVNDPVTFE